MLIVLATHDLDVVDGLLTRELFLRERPACVAIGGRAAGRCAIATGRRWPRRDASFFRVAWLVVRKDMMVEVRSLEVLSTTLFFAVTVVLVFSFGLVREGRPVDDVAAGILWIAMAFSGTLALGRTFERERQTDTLRALMLAPADRPAIYVGKLVGMLLLLGAGGGGARAAGRAAVPGAALRRTRGR